MVVSLDDQRCLAAAERVGARRQDPVVAGAPPGVAPAAVPGVRALSTHPGCRRFRCHAGEGARRAIRSSKIRI
jgi:hypothetical protein